MKKSILLGLGACALALGGVAALVGQKGAVETSAAYTTKPLYLRGTINGWEADEGYKFEYDSGTGLHTLKNVSLDRGGYFKVANDDYSYQYGKGKLKGNTGTAASFFESSDDDQDNSDVYIHGSGVYDITVDTTNHKITTDFHESATYSYILSDNKTDELTYAFMYESLKSEGAENDNVLYSTVNNAPKLDGFGGGMAYNVKFGTSGLSLYKLDNRFFGALPYTKLTDKTHYSSKIEYNSAKGLYLDEGGAVTSFTDADDRYAAAEFVYDVAALRAPASYHSVDLAFSICAADQEKAAALVNTYDNVLTDPQKAYVNQSTINTYDVETTVNEYEKDDIPLTDIVQTLRVIAAGEKDGVHSIPTFGVEAEDKTPVIITIISLGGLLSLGGVFLFRRKKAE